VSPDATTLADTSWTQLPDRPIVLVPLGSTEQHGPHLPFSTDTTIADAVARASAPRIAAATGLPVVVAPALPYGASGEHQSFPGTISIGHDALRLLLVELIRSLSTWAGRIILVNGHGGNALTLKAVVDQMRYEQHNVSSIPCALESATDAHAGHDETSVLLHLSPHLVRMESAQPGNTQPLAEILPDLMRSGVRPVSPTGVLGDPTAADPDAGRASFDALVDALVGHAINGSETSHG
jgi:creatinine amidohydrolase